MLRRDLLTQPTTLLAAASFGLPAMAQMKTPEEGLEYIKLDKVVPTEATAGKIEVVEFFWYNCPHCNAFEPRLEEWLKKLPPDVHFRRIPAAFREDFVPQQKLFFALEAMKLVDKLHKRVFAAIHVEKLNLATRDNIIDWVAKQGVDKAAFIASYDSFGVSNKTSRATLTQQGYRVGGVPSLGIAGRFYTDGSTAQSMERALQVTDYLIAQQRPKK